MTEHVFKLDAPVSTTADAIMSLRSFFVVDFKDTSNWIALAIAIPLLIWGITMIMNRLG